MCIDSFVGHLNAQFMHMANQSAVAWRPQIMTTCKNKNTVFDFNHFAGWLPDLVAGNQHI